MEFLKSIVAFFDCFTVWIVTFEMLLLGHKEKRRGFIWRQFLFLPLLIIPNDAFSALMPWEGSFFLQPVFMMGVMGSWAYLLAFALSLLAVWFCFAIPFRQVLFYGATAYIMEHLSQHIKWLLLGFVTGNMAPNINSLEYPIVMITSKLLVAGVVYYAFIRSYRKNNEVGVNNLFLIVFMAASLLFVTVLNSYAFSIGLSNSISSFYAIICCILLLMIQFSVFNEAKSREAESTMASLLVKQSEQQAMKKESIEAINRKCHDLKYRIKLLNTLHQNDEENGPDEIQEAIRTYEGMVETGNAILDIILTEAMVLCQREDIRFSVSGNAVGLSFLSNQDIAALFGNAIDNAIEYERKIEPKYRNIDVIFREQGHLLKVSVENYCAEKLKFIDGIPQTTKDNSGGDHGHGIRSIMYIVRKYDGNVMVYQEQDRYVLSMLFNTSCK